MGKDKKKFKIGQRVKIIGGAPYCFGRVWTDDVGKTGVVIKINNKGWDNPELGKYAYRVSLDGDRRPLWYPFPALKKID